MICMNGIEIDEKRLEEICRRWRVAELSVFGSVVRGEAGPDSDVDLLYVVEPDSRVGWDIVDLEDELSKLFGRKVDLVSKRYVHPLIRDEVLSTARVLYAA